MPEILLRGNQRIGYVCRSIAGIGVATGLFIVWKNEAVIMDGLGVCLVLLGVTARYFARQLFLRPRLALTKNELIVNARSLGRPIQVPLAAVEVFFIGQGAVRGLEPGQPKDYEGAVAANVIVRMADAATDWQQHETQLWLAVWRDGYITIRGLWCEDINQELLKSMNKKLLAAKRKLRDSEPNQ